MVLRPLVSNTELMSMNTRLNKLEKRRDKIIAEIANIQNLSIIFFKPEQVDWNDPKIPVNQDEFMALEKDVDDLFWEIEEAKAIRNNTYKEYEAKKNVIKFLESIPDKVAFKYLKTIGCNALQLVDRVVENPEYIKETYYDALESMEWLQIVRVEDNMVFVKTIRGIEPARLANADCNNAKVNDYALCKSVRSNLFVFDYAHAEVTA